MVILVKLFILFQILSLTRLILSVEFKYFTFALLNIDAQTISFKVWGFLVTLAYLFFALSLGIRFRLLGHVLL